MRSNLPFQQDNDLNYLAFRMKNGYCITGFLPKPAESNSITTLFNSNEHLWSYLEKVGQKYITSKGQIKLALREKWEPQLNYVIFQSGQHFNFPKFLDFSLTFPEIFS